ncbi:MAG: carboxylating nicotinate-nucleotide diphosphorylase [Methermicoccaceae archaeon]
MMVGEIERFLEEDVGWTEELLNIVEGEATAKVIFREAGVLAGATEAKSLFEYLGLNVTHLQQEGKWVKKDDAVLEVTGDAAMILKGERVALNLIGRMSGIATYTRRCVEKLESMNSHTKVACTRKTTPGFRKFEKKAVVLGGGDTHRFNQSDAVIVKDNHIKLLGIDEAVRKARKVAGFMRKVEVEVENLEECAVAAREGVDVLMFDNMSPHAIERCKDYLDSEGLLNGILLEASGGITYENLGEYANLGLDFVSMGSIVHSAPFLDVSLEIYSENDVKN